MNFQVLKVNYITITALAFSDGYSVAFMPLAQDFKRIGDNDEGSNTGGMGAYAPVPIGETVKQEAEEIIRRTIKGLRREGKPFRGVLYAGLFVTPDGLFCLEFNSRFGDPETQALLPLLESDLAEVIEACVEGHLDSVQVKWKAEESSVTVVMASKGYPEVWEKGKQISQGESPSGITVFHAGTSLVDNQLVTSGGRVLAVTAVNSTLQGARESVYEYLPQISFEGNYYRRDIAAKAIQATRSSTTYSEAGVDILEADRLIDAIKPAVKRTKRPGTSAELGGFGGLYDLKAEGYSDPILVSGTDGVGTKLLIAQSCNSHSTIGIDLVAMSVNDILVQGAEPLFFLDYFATGKLQLEVAKEVIEGVAQGCEQAGCALIGGETAEMPGMYPPGKYDLAGFAVGAVERSQILPKSLTPGDVILGLSSSGLHSNGFSLVRHILSKHQMSYDSSPPFAPQSSLGEILLSPTRIYVRSCLEVIKKGLVKALAHITGGGLTENIPRILDSSQSAIIDLQSWELPPLFKWLASLGNVQQDELLRTLNCGVGMILVVSPNCQEEVKKILESHKEEVFTLGTIQLREETPVVYRSSGTS